MKKSQLALLTFRVNQLEAMKQISKDYLVEIIQSSFSAIASIDPALALSLAEQINAQKDGILALQKDREVDQEEYVQKMTEHMSDFMEFETEDEDEQYN